MGRPDRHGAGSKSTEPDSQRPAAAITISRTSSPPANYQSTNIGQHVSSQAVSWWAVHEYVAPLLERVGSWPTLGTAAWCALPDDDKRKLAALLDAAQHWALRVETCQQAHADASHEISAAENWSAMAAAIRRRKDSAQ